MPDFDIIEGEAGWVKRPLDPQLQSWKTIPLSLLHSVGGPLLFKYSFSLRTLPGLPLLPPFYRDVLSAWASISKHTTSTKNEMRMRKMRSCGIIMRSLLVANLFFFYKQWYDADVKTLPDILDKEGKFLTFTEFKKKYKINTKCLCYILASVMQPQSTGGKPLRNMSQFSHLRNCLPLAGKHARFMYLSLSKSLHQKFVLLTLDSQIILSSTQSYEKHKAFYVLI